MSPGKPGKRCRCRQRPVLLPPTPPKPRPPELHCLFRVALDFLFPRPVIWLQGPARATGCQSSGAPWQVSFAIGAGWTWRREEKDEGSALGPLSELMLRGARCPPHPVPLTLPPCPPPAGRGPGKPPFCFNPGLGATAGGQGWGRGTGSLCKSPLLLPSPARLRGMQTCPSSPCSVTLPTQSIHRKEQIKPTDPPIFNDRRHWPRVRLSTVFEPCGPERRASSFPAPRPRTAALGWS